MAVWMTSCSPNTIVATEVSMLSTTPIQTHTLTPTATPFQPEIVETELPNPTPTLEPTATLEPKNISLDGFYSVSIQSEVLTDWYRSLFKGLEIKWCEKCSLEQIEALLEFGGETWVVVQQEHVLYTHSGWSITGGPEFGEILLRISKSGNLKDVIICLEEKICYEVIDFKILGREAIGGSISLGELFNVQEDDYFIFTCATQVLPGVPTPKLILQIRLID